MVAVTVFKEQFKAADPQTSVWVAANAGTGKTKVLTDRVLRLLLDETTRPEKILCLTYTKAAAAEMSHRINRKLAHWAVIDRSKLAEELQQLTQQKPSERLINRARILFSKVLDAPEGIRIQTLHSFCQSLLRRFPLEAGCNPRFELIDERTNHELMQEIKTRMLHRLRVEGEGAAEPVTLALRELTGLLSENDFSKLLQTIVSQRGEFQEAFDALAPEIMQSRLFQQFDLAETITPEQLVQQAFFYSIGELSGLQHLMFSLEGEKGAKIQNLVASLRHWLSLTPEQRAQAFNFYRSLYLTNDETLRKDWEKLADKRPDLAPVLLSETARILSLLERLRQLATVRASHCVIEVASHFLFEHARVKNERAWMDYDDLIRRSVALLEKPGICEWVLFKLDQGIDHLLVDEAQDTSPEQWRLVQRLTEEFFAGQGANEIDRTLFVVGDEKQSIYSFQGARPEWFSAMRRHLSGHIREAGKQFEEITLDLSFRTSEPVLQVVDRVFSLPTLREAVTQTAEPVKHESHRTGHSGRVELWPVFENVKEARRESWQVPEKPESRRKSDILFAAHIAETIKGWMDIGEELPAYGRSLQYGDMMVLVRRRSKFVDHLIHALKEREIPVAGVDRLKITEHIAVEDMLSLVRFVLLPEDNLSLAELLTSPLVGFTDEQLMELAAGRPAHLSLWSTLRQKATQEGQHYASALARLESYITEGYRNPPYNFFSFVLEVDGGLKRLLERLGEEAMDPLSEFLDMALGYERLHTATLQGFYHWMTADEAEIKRDQEQHRNEVRILTVHASKGLEAPVIILPDTIRPAQMTEKLFWHYLGSEARNGKPQRLLLYSPRREQDCQLLSQLKEDKAQEIQNEYWRLLYVAMTRARDRLYIGGYRSGNQTVREDCWYSACAEALRQLGTPAEPPLYLPHDLQTPQHVLVYATEHKAEVPKPKDIVSSHLLEEIKLPDYALTPAPEDPNPPRPLYPSQMNEDEEVHFPPVLEKKLWERGRIIHQLLQLLGDNKPQQSEKLIERFLSTQSEKLTAEEQEKIAQEVKVLLNHPDFGVVFQPEAASEVPIGGVITDANGQPRVLSGQIDRIYVSAEEIVLVDFKTNRNPPRRLEQAPVAYLRQMHAYARILKEVYPGRRIRAALLWTALPLWMEIPLE